MYNTIRSNPKHWDYAEQELEIERERERNNTLSIVIQIRLDGEVTGHF